jgi:hypothetical protein
MNEITPVQRLPNTYSFVQTVEKVIPGAYGDTIQKTNYVVTVYDQNGKIQTTTASHQINYLV